MSENQKFKTKYDEMRQGNPASSNNYADQDETENALYKHAGNIRNVCFLWPDGNKQSFSYSYLVSKKLEVTGEVNTITINFTSDTVTLKGYNLEKLFSQLDNQIVYLITQVEQRYAETREEDQITVTEILVNATP